MAEALQLLDSAQQQSTLSSSPVAAGVDATATARLEGVLAAVRQLLRSAQPAASMMSPPVETLAATGATETVVTASSGSLPYGSMRTAGDGCGFESCSFSSHQPPCTPPQLDSREPAVRWTKGSSGDDGNTARGPAADTTNTRSEASAAPTATGSDDMDASCADAATEAEVDARMDAIAASCYIVPDLSSADLICPKGAELLQTSVCSSVWVMPLGVSGAGSGSQPQQKMLVKTSYFFSEERAAQVLEAAALSGQEIDYVMPTKRDAMFEARMAVQVACASARLHPWAGPAASSANPVFRDLFVQPVHMEVQQRSGNSGSSSSEPDYMVVAVYEYHETGNARSYLDNLVDELMAQLSHPDEDAAMAAVRHLANSFYQLNWDMFT